MVSCFGFYSFLWAYDLDVTATFFTAQQNLLCELDLSLSLSRCVFCPAMLMSASVNDVFLEAGFVEA